MPRTTMQHLAKLLCAALLGAFIGCEKHKKENQDYPANQHVPAEGHKGTPPPPNPPPQPPTTGSQQSVGTGTR
jgi:hypothetical protein